MSRLNTLCTTKVEDPQDETGMCEIGCQNQKLLCQHCWWGGSGLNTPICDFSIDAGLTAPIDVYRLKAKL